jgi:CubicO group peptidase (beta-lactamase class C family)
MPIRSGFPLVALIAAYAVTVAPSPAQEAAMTAAPSPAGTYAAAVARIAAAAPEAMRRQHAPGMALALVDRRGTIAILTFGEADIEHHVPVTARTRFGIGSITKSMTTIALMQARDRGAFDPRAPVTRYLPWFSVHTRWRALTGRDLLTHTSGLPDGGIGFGQPYDVALLREASTGFAPGTRWSYSNLGFETLGAVLEAIDHRAWDTIVRDDVLARVGMTASAPDWTLDALRTAATGYLPRDDDRLTDPRRWDFFPVPLTEFSDPAGSVLATAGDMAKYARMLLDGSVAGDGTRLISPSSYALLTTAATTAGTGGVPALYERYAYGLAVRRFDGDRVIGHTGGTVAYTACMEADLDSGFAVVALTNAGDNADRPCPIVEYGLRSLRAAARGSAGPLFPAATDPAEVAHAARLAGTFRAASGATLTVVAPAGNRLALRVAGRLHSLLPVGGGIFFCGLQRYRDSGLRFVLDPHMHRARALVAAGVWYAAPGTAPGAAAAPRAWHAYAGHYRYAGAHPYDASLRIQLVNGALVVDDGTPLTPLGDGEFRLGEPWSPELLRFDTVIAGAAQRLRWNGVPLYRVTTP